MAKRKAEKAKKKSRPDIVELSLRPYIGTLWLARTREAYDREHKRIFNVEDHHKTNQAGRFAVGESENGALAYLIWASNAHTLAHELSHVILDVFERVGIDPRAAGGEPFCYMLSQLLLDAE